MLSNRSRKSSTTAEEDVKTSEIVCKLQTELQEKKKQLHELQMKVRANINIPSIYLSIVNWLTVWLILTLFFMGLFFKKTLFEKLQY